MNERGISVARPFRPRAAHNRRLLLERLEPRDLLAAFDVLVFSKTAGFRHTSIDEGIAAIQALGAANDFTVIATEDAAAFNAANLAQLRSRRLPDDHRRRAERGAANRVRAVHPGRRRLGRRPLGGRHRVRLGLVRRARWAPTSRAIRRSSRRPSSSPTRCTRRRPTCPSGGSAPTSGTTTRRTPAATCTCWRRSTSRPTPAAPMGSITRSPGITTTTAAGRGTPAWGTPTRRYAEPLFRQHLLGGIRYAAGADSVRRRRDGRRQLSQGRPRAGRAQPHGARRRARRPRVLRRARRRREGLRSRRRAPRRSPAQFRVFTGGEDGLLGLALDPNFATNQLGLPLLFARRRRREQRLSRFTLVGQSARHGLRADPAHAFPPTARQHQPLRPARSPSVPDGELYISTGDNTNPFESNGFAPDRRAPGPRRLRRAAKRRRTPTTCAARSCASCRSPTARTRFPPATCSRPTARRAGRRSS